MRFPLAADHETFKQGVEQAPGAQEAV